MAAKTKIKTKIKTVSDEQAALLAAHAIHVQKGFSTPEIEKERAEKDLAEGAVFNWAKIRGELVHAVAAETAEATQSDEAVAALEEGLAPMPEDLVPFREEMLSVKEELERLEGRKKELQDIFGKRLDDDGLIGYLLNGKVHARVTKGTRHSVDSKKLKERMPHIWSQFLKITPYRSVRVD